MKVIVKKPDLDGEVCEVADLAAINKIVGNIDENGNGINRTGSDMRMSIGLGVDMYVYEAAINNFAEEQNLWAPGDNAMLFGNIVFAGYNENSNENYGACSLTDEQVEFVKIFIEKQRA